MTRITNADQLRRGMVLTIHYPQTHPGAGVNVKPFDWEGCVVTEVEKEHFVVVYKTKVPGCPKYQTDRYHFRDCQIISKAVPTLRETACNWAESTGEKTEEEVQQMLSDDCI